MKIAASITPNITQFGPLLFPGEIEKAMKVLSELGYDGIELSLRTPEDVSATVLNNMLDSNKLELLSIATGQTYLDDGLSLFAWDPDVRMKVIERIKGYIDLVSPFSGCVILGGVKGSLIGRNDEMQYNNGCQAIDECLSYAEKKNAVLLLESINRYETNLFNTVVSCCNFAEERKSDSLKILPDTFHMNIEEVSILGALDNAGDHIGAIHCADSNRLAPGMGHIDFKDVLCHIGDYPSLKYLGVEVLPLPDSSTSVRTAMETVRKCLPGGNKK